MERTTRKQVQSLFSIVTENLGKLENRWEKKDGRNVATIGAWYLDYNDIYGGYVINEIVNEGGGVKNPLGMLRRSTRDMWEFLHSINNGLMDKAFRPMKEA